MKKITLLAREFRRKQTKAERIFWQAVRNRKVGDHKFYRQYPIEFIYDDQKRYFIADCYCHDSQLVVEIDGGIHEQQKDYDTFRTAIINQLEIRVIRYTNKEVTDSMDRVKINLLEELSGKQKCDEFH